MTSRLRLTGRARVLVPAAIIVAGLFVAIIGRALGQSAATPGAAHRPVSHQATVTISRPTTTLGGQISPSNAPPALDDLHPSDLNDKHGGGDGDGGADGDGGH